MRSDANAPATVEYVNFTVHTVTTCFSPQSRLHLCPHLSSQRARHTSLGRRISDSSHRPSFTLFSESFDCAIEMANTKSGPTRPRGRPRLNPKQEAEGPPPPPPQPRRKPSASPSDDSQSTGQVVTCYCAKCQAQLGRCYNHWEKLSRSYSTLVADDPNLFTAIDFDPDTQMAAAGSELDGW